ncbi:hypothetical protein J5N97_012566 [Dioscorea zingiberensis]|uniref:Uncharacterized protein n=1 Tax=Dioscorea zingiberensis TaxID=325984 RepID=A0A9D5CQK0_9LILI|nr:hypothetical protein J5N97_012566 [Dioscorea zingiberensis]
MYPLYKSLACALERYLSSGTFLKVPDSDDESFKSKEGEWSKLFLENGSELMKIFEAVDFELHVQEPFFSQLRGWRHRHTLGLRVLLEVKVSSLTHAARALAKHFGRNSDGWWGIFSGSDSDKNRLASGVINRLLSNCSWMNVHLIKPYECVFEIRVPEGYGARLSQDGLKKKAIHKGGNIRTISIAECLSLPIPSLPIPKKGKKKNDC